MRFLLILAALYAALSLIHVLIPGPCDADVRGPAKAVQSLKFPGN